MDKNTLLGFGVIFGGILLFVVGFKNIFSVIAALCGLLSCLLAYEFNKEAKMSPEEWRKLPKNNKVNLSKDKSKEPQQPTPKLTRTLIYAALFLFFISYLGLATDKSIISLVIGTVSGLFAFVIGLVLDEIFDELRIKGEETAVRVVGYLFFLAIVFVLLIITIVALT